MCPNTRQVKAEHYCLAFLSSERLTSSQVWNVGFDLLGG